jgi:hypothetical protein
LQIALVASIPAAVCAAVIVKYGHGTTRLIAFVVLVVLVTFLLIAGDWTRRHPGEEVEH